MLEIKNVSFRYANSSQWILRNFDFSATKGELIAVTGANGSGKTTLLNIIGGVIPKVIVGDFAGEIFWEGDSLSQLSLPQTAPLISLLMQEPDNQLFFPTVEQELAFAPENLRLDSTEIENRISQALRILDIESLRFADTSTLSFGQKKLVAFAALLTLSPRVLLVDEISTGLSERFMERVIDALKYEMQSGKIIFAADNHPAILQLASQQISLGN